VPAGSRSTTSGSGARASGRTTSQLVGKRKSQRPRKLGRLDGALQQMSSTWRCVHASASDFSNHGRTSFCQQPETRAIRGRGIIAALLPGSAAKLRPLGSLKHTAIDSDPSEFNVSDEKNNRRMYCDMSGHLISKLFGTTHYAQVVNNAY